MNRLLILFVPLLLLADSLLKDFKEGKYNKICTYSRYHKYLNSPEKLSLIGLACIKIDKIFLLPAISYHLRKTYIGRKNSIYFLTIVMQKRLIYSYLFDKSKDIFYFSFPKTDYFLSDIFEAIKSKNFKKDKNFYIIRIKNITYKMFKNGTFLEIDEYKNKKLIKRHLFR